MRRVISERSGVLTSSGSRRVSGFVRFQLYCWGVFSVSYFAILNILWGSPLRALGMIVMMVPVYGLVSLGLGFLYSRLRLRARFEVKTLVIVSVGVLCGAGISDLFSQVVLEFLDFLLEARDRAHPLMRFIFHSWVLGAWSSSYLWAKSEIATRKEREQREGALVAAERAELQMLRFQLNPHFLFNSLNNVITEIQKRPDVALEMTHRLAEYMRHSLEYKGETLVPLEHEVEGAREYLEIEMLRFENQLEVRFECEDIDEALKVPSFLLQPLVENAVKHGMNSSQPPWRIILQVEAVNDEVKMRISSSGELKKNREVKSGVGLDILHRRLALHYPSRAEFTLRQEDDLVIAELNLKGEPC